MPLPRHPDGSFWYEKWLGTALAFDGYQLLRPVRPTPGGLAIVVPKVRLKEVSELMRDPGMKHWQIRGVIGQQQFLPSTLPTLQGSLIKGRNKTWISTIGSKSAGGFTQFMVHADAEENVTDICYGVADPNPVAALAKAREPLEEVLDELACIWGTPLHYSRFDLAAAENAPALATEMFLPFGPYVALDERPKLLLMEWASILNELYREALCATSPYYRLLCAFRLVDGITSARNETAKICQQLNVAARFPVWEQIPVEEIPERGATLNVTGMTTLSLPALRDAWIKKRNAVAHFIFEKEKKQPDHILILSRAIDYRDFACSAAILLLYCRRSLDTLIAFVREHMEPPPDAIMVDFS